MSSFFVKTAVFIVFLGSLTAIFTNRFFHALKTLGAQGLTTSPGHYFHFFVIARAPYTAFI